MILFHQGSIRCRVYHSQRTQNLKGHVESILFIIQIKNRNETRGKHILPFITGMVSLRIFFKTNSYLFKIAIVVGFYMIVFDMSYTLGQHLFNLFKFPSILIIISDLFNNLLRINDGESIQSMQTRLFIKKCLLDQYREDNKITTKPSWMNSYVMNEAVWKNLLKARKSLFLNRI